jgi:multimeric flavodoxin WrbA
MTDLVPDTPALRAAALVCSLNASPEPSSSQQLAEQVLHRLSEHGVESGPDDVVRVVDYDVKPGVVADVGDGDQWPQLREKMLAADILVLATPTWLGQHSSVCQRVLERLDAELSEQDEHGRQHTLDKVALAVVVGNEDGAHHISGVLFQALNDLGFSIAAQGVTYWNGEAMSGTDYKDLDEPPAAVASATSAAAANAAHLARVLRQSPYPS